MNIYFFFSEWYFIIESEYVLYNALVMNMCYVGNFPPILWVENIYAKEDEKE